MKRFIHLSDLHFSHKGKTQNEIYFETRQTILDVLIKIKLELVLLGVGQAHLLDILIDWQQDLIIDLNLKQEYFQKI